MRASEISEWSELLVTFAEDQAMVPTIHITQSIKLPLPTSEGTRHINIWYTDRQSDRQILIHIM